MQYHHNKSIIIVAGPTAVGKTALSIALAKRFNTSILSADSRQCYREMTIGTAKPSAEELQEVKHYFVNSHSINDRLTVADYEQYALSSLNTIFSHANVSIVCGGTGLYIKALCEGIDEMPAIDENIKFNTEEEYKSKGLEWLQTELQRVDSLFFNTAEQQNPARLLRALIFYRTHHHSISQYQTGTSKKRDFNIIKLALELPREVLYDRINRRVDQMIEEGLVEEVKRLNSFRNLKNLQTVGYQELFDFFDGNIELPKAIDLIKQHTRNYAKRQMTWFKKDKNYKWFSPDDTKTIDAFIEAQLHKA